MGQTDRPAIRRDRTGCWNCKARRRKCPGERPSCAACLRRGLVCTYGIRLLWQDDAEAAGIAFGRANLKDRYCKPPDQRSQHGQAEAYHIIPRVDNQLFWLNTSFNDIQSSSYTELSTRDSGWQPKSPPSAIGSIPRPLANHIDLGQCGGALFRYYTQVWSCHRTLADKSENAFQTILIPLSYGSQELLDMILAYAAHGLANTSNDESSREHYYSLMLHYKLRSLRQLQRTLRRSFHVNAHGAQLLSRMELDGMLVTTMLQSFLEISTDSTSEWATHTAGALCLIEEHYRHLNSGSSAPGMFSPKVVSLVDDHAAIHRILLASTGAKLEAASANRVERFPPTATSTDERSLSKINSYTGFSQEVLDIISSITSVIHQTPQGGVTSNGSTSPVLDTRLAQLRRIEHRLHNLRQWSDESEPDGLIFLNASAFECAVWLYLRYALPADSNDTVTGRAQLLERLLQILHNVHERHGCLAGSLPYPMWALFIAACVVPEEHRAQIMGWFTSLKASRPYSNVPSTMKTVMSLWKRHDLGLDADRCGSGREHISPEFWEQAIKASGRVMSLT